MMIRDMLEEKYGDGDGDDDWDSICGIVCLEKFSVQICDSTKGRCVRWTTLHMISAIAFFIMTILGGISALIGGTGGCLKLSQCATAAAGIVCLLTVVGYSSAKTYSEYTSHVEIMFGIAMSITGVWVLWALKRWWRYRTHINRYVRNDTYSTLLLTQDL